MIKKTFLKHSRDLKKSNERYDVLDVQKLNSESKHRKVKFKMKIVMNPDKEFAKEIKDKLKQNGGYCPCRIIKNPDTKCKCKEFREMVERGESGMCHCGLWIARKGESDEL